MTIAPDVAGARSSEHRLYADEQARRRQRSPALALLAAIVWVLALWGPVGCAATSATFTVENVADTGGREGYAGDGEPATDAMPHFPARVAFDRADNPHRANRDNLGIRRVDAASGILSTVAGTGLTGFGADGGPATAATFGGVNSAAVGDDSNPHIADLPANDRIRGVEASGILSTVAGAGPVAFSRHGGPATAAPLNPWQRIAAHGTGNPALASEIRPRRFPQPRRGARDDLRLRVDDPGRGPLGFIMPTNAPLALTAHTLHSGAGIGPDNSQTPYAPLPLEPPHVTQPSASAGYTKSTCPEFHKLNGEDLVQAVLNADGACITWGISYPPTGHLEFLFAEERMITIIQKLEELAEIYQGNNQDKIGRFLEYTLRGYHYRIYYLSTLDQFFTERLKAELHQGLSAFVNNTHFTSIPITSTTNQEHLHILRDFLYLLDVSNEATPYIDFLVDLLDRFSLGRPAPSRYDIDGYDIIQNVLYIYKSAHVQHIWLFDTANNFEFRDHILNNDIKALDALIRFSKRYDLSNSERIINDTSSVLHSAVENIGLFLQYGDYPEVYHLAHGRIEEVLSQYSIDSDGKFLRFLASNAIKYWSQHSSSDLKPSCSTPTYDICNDDLDWRDALFPPEYSYRCQATDEEVLF